MGQILHARATTTHAVRKAIQQSNETMVKLAEIYKINVKTVKKWKSRSSVNDDKMGTKQLGSTVLTPLEERLIVEFRVRTQCSIDDIYIALKDEIPNLSRSSLHRCLQRHGVSKPIKDVEEDGKTKKFKSYDLGYVHIDSAEVRTDEGKAYLFVAVDRASKLALAKVYKNKDKKSSCEFLKYLMSKIPYMMDIILTDNGTEFTDIRCQDKSISQHEFTSICRAHNIEHRHTKVKHPWTNGQVERMNRTIKYATTKRFHYETMEQLQEHLDRFLIAYNTAKPLKALGFRTVLQFLMDCSIKLNYKFKNSNLLNFTGHYS